MICFDTMVLIWGVQGEARPSQQAMIDRTRRFIASLREGNEQIMVPTPALAEYLQGFDNEARKRQLTVLEQSFFIPAFDLPAAYLAAGLARESRGLEGKAVDRHAIRTDCHIIATAIVHGATRIITNDVDHFQKLARDKIPVSEVPDVHEQTNLDLNP